jgi:hypothetical protein
MLLCSSEGPGDTVTVIAAHGTGRHDKDRKVTLSDRPAGSSPRGQPQCR